MAKKQEIPTTFEEGRNFTLEIFHERPSSEGHGKTVWWQMGGASTIRRCFETVKYKQDGDLVNIVAQYSRGKTEATIGKGIYRKRGPYGQFATLETVEAEGAMVGLVETALVALEEERRAAEEAARTYPCDYPGCSEQVLATLGPACMVKVQIGAIEQTLFFYGCEGSHHEALASPEKLSVALQIAKSTASLTVRTTSDARIIDLVEQARGQ